MTGRMVVDDDEQILADVLRELRRLRARLATGQVYGTHDEFTAAATPETTYQLTYIPVAGTCGMFNNGLEQTEDTDYTVDYDTGLVTFVTALTTGDHIDFRYLITDWLVARSLPEEIEGIADTFNRANSALTLNPSSDGGTWIVDPGSVYGITSNQAYCVSGSGGTPTPGIPTAYIAWRDALTNAVQLQIDNFRSSTAGASALWVSFDPVTGNGYQLSFDSSGSFGVLHATSTDGHAHPSAGFFPTAWTGGTTSLRLKHDGAGNAEVWQLVSGTWTLVCSIADTAFPQTVGTLVGFGTAATSVGVDLWDNFTAIPA